jgi:hypothetical protein
MVCPTVSLRRGINRVHGRAGRQMNPEARTSDAGNRWMTAAFAAQAGSTPTLLDDIVSA